MATSEHAREAWVNWNPDPLIHAYGEQIGSRPIIVAMCRVTVREWRGDFDPDDPKACPDCASYVREGLTLAEARDRVSERTRDSFIIECRRP